MPDKYEDRYLSYEETAEALGGYDRVLVAIRDGALRPGDALLVREEDFFADYPEQPERIQLTAADYEEGYEPEYNQITRHRHLDIYDVLAQPRFEKAAVQKALRRQNKGGRPVSNENTCLWQAMVRWKVKNPSGSWAELTRAMKDLAVHVSSPIEDRTIEKMVAHFKDALQGRPIPWSIQK